MRLLNIYTFKFKEFHDDEIPPYVITSHRWSDDEATLKDVQKRRKTASKGHQKIAGFCSAVSKDNEFLRIRNPQWPVSKWIWIDTCCINKSSDAEVSESINSMFGWYTRSRECLAYLADVRPLSAGREAVLDDFRHSVWFTRGWTLQELLAPVCVIFLTQNWEVIGHKCSFCQYDRPCLGAGPLFNRQIGQVTGINEDILFEYSNSQHLSIGQKMQWMENRATTRIEDMAYCQLGIFDVNMPLVYGEGHKALLRLGVELDKAQSEDSDSRGPSATREAGIDQGTTDERLVSLADSDQGQSVTTTPFTPGESRPSNQEQMSRLLSRMIERTQSRAKRPSAIRSTEARTDYVCLDPSCASAGVAFTRETDLHRHISVTHTEAPLEIEGIPPKPPYSGTSVVGKSKEPRPQDPGWSALHRFNNPTPRDPGWSAPPRQPGWSGMYRVEYPVSRDPWIEM